MKIKNLSPLLPTSYFLPASKGFTLIELIIVMAILAVVGALSVPFIQSFQVSSNLSTHTTTITQTLRRAQQQAIAGQNSSSWGVYFDDGVKMFILFLGNDFATRDQSYDLATDYPEVFTVTTNFADEIYFSIFSGQPSTVGTVNVSSLNNETKTISIDSFGLIQIQ